jgi:hypothetical protein
MPLNMLRAVHVVVKELTLLHLWYVKYCWHWDVRLDLQLDMVKYCWYPSSL